MTEDKTIFTEFEFVGDFKDFINFNDDVKFDNPADKEKLKSITNDSLLEIKKAIGSETTILSFKEVSEETLTI